MKFDKKMPLMHRLLAAGYKKKEMYHWYSDLYVIASPLVDEVIDGWCEDNGFQRSHFVKPFSDRVTGLKMYDCTFQWIGFWEAA